MNQAVRLIDCCLNEWYVTERDYLNQVAILQLNCTTDSNGSKTLPCTKTMAMMSSDCVIDLIVPKTKALVLTKKEKKKDVSEKRKNFRFLIFFQSNNLPNKLFLRLFISL